MPIRTHRCFQVAAPRESFVAISSRRTRAPGITPPPDDDDDAAEINSTICPALPCRPVALALLSLPFPSCRGWCWSPLAATPSSAIGSIRPGVAMATTSAVPTVGLSTARMVDPPCGALRCGRWRPQSGSTTLLPRSVGTRAGRVVMALTDSVTQDSMKRAVAKKAVELVKSGMVLGLGTGSTSQFFIEELGILLSQNKLRDVECVATSYQSRVLSRQYGVKSLELNDVNHIDLAFDGADEVDASMNLIKGGGAAHTMEKVVDSIAKRCVILVDETKVVKTLGLTFPVPVEVLPFALAPVLRALAALGGQPEIRTALRKDGPVMTDLGNMVVDVRFPEGVPNPAELERKINMIPGVVENGLFINVAHTVLVGTKDGDETSVVEFADFVETLRNSAGVSAS